MTDWFEVAKHICAPVVNCSNCYLRVVPKGEDFCPQCREKLAGASWERRMEDGETFRGGEAAAYDAEQQEWIQRNLK